MSPLLEYRDVSVTTTAGRSVLQNISLALETGTMTAILGRSGSGKTTLLRTANRMAIPAQGQILFETSDIANLDVVALRRKMGYVIQETGLFPHFNVQRNVSMVLEAEGRPRTQRHARSEELLRLVGLDPVTYADRLPHQLSGGQRQRVGLARALAAEPRLLLMDEPFGALDPLTRAEMQDMLRQLLSRLHTTVLFVTHDLDEALYLAQRIVLLDEGRVVANLAPGEFLQSTQPGILAYIRAYHRADSRASSDPSARSGRA